MELAVKALVAAPIAFGALTLGYLWGYGVGEREGQDSDPDAVRAVVKDEMRIQVRQGGSRVLPGHGGINGG